MTLRVPVRAIFALSGAITTALGFFCPGSLVAASTDLPAITVNGHGWQVPVLESRVVPRSGTKGPAPVQDFWAANGREWRVFWDYLLETPRLVLPLQPVELVPAGALGPDPDRTLLKETAEMFIDEHSALFGVDSGELADPFIYPVAQNWVLVFQQTTPGGIPVRGASIRLIIRENGELSWVKSFVMRECPDPNGALLDEGVIQSSVVPSGLTILRGRLEIGFPANDPAQGMPIWSLDVAEEDGITTEYIVDARTGTVLERRRIVKHFDEEGLFMGRSPTPFDIFSSPQAGPALLSGMKGASVRGTDSKILDVTGDDGFFTVTTNQNPAVLTLSLESGPFSQTAGFEPLLQIRPLDAQLVQLQIDPHEDANGDGVPDISANVFEGQNALVIFNDGTSGDDYIFRAWWLQAYHHSQRMIDFAQDAFDRFDLAGERIVPLAVEPTIFDGLQQWTPPNSRVPGFAEILTSLTFEVGRDPQGQKIIENVVPTVVQHEVGHHIVFGITGAHEAETKGIEEGIADAMVGFTNDDCRIGFKSQSEATPLGFCLGEIGDFRPAIRAKIGNGFFNLRTLLRNRVTPENTPDPQAHVAHGLLAHWLARHKVADPRQRILGEIEGIVEELIKIDEDLVFQTSANCPVPCHAEEIRQAFDGFIIALFVRGDANLDQRVDLSDAVAILNFLFSGQGGFHDCKDAMDADDNGSLEVTDGIRILNFLFQGGEKPAAPFEECGFDTAHDPVDPNATKSLGCLEFTCPR
jgi:hypothetical protein